MLAARLSLSARGLGVPSVPADCCGRVSPAGPDGLVPVQPSAFQLALIPQAPVVAQDPPAIQWLGSTDGKLPSTRTRISVHTSLSNDQRHGTAIAPREYYEAGGSVQIVRRAIITSTKYEYGVQETVSKWLQWNQSWSRVLQGDAWKCNNGRSCRLALPFPAPTEQEGLFAVLHMHIPSKLFQAFETLLTCASTQPQLFSRTERIVAPYRFGTCPSPLFSWPLCHHQPAEPTANPVCHLRTQQIQVPCKPCRIHNCQARSAQNN